MKKTTTILAMVALLVALTAGTALAAAITCPTGQKGLCKGSEQDDLLTGTDERDRIEALDGRDAVFAGGDDDTIKGGKNVVYGGDGGDQIDASTTEADGGDVEKIFGGESNNTIINDGVKDIIDCGKGEQDQVLIDEGLDVTKGCESRFPADEATAAQLMAQPGDDDQEQQQLTSPQAE